MTALSAETRRLSLHPAAIHTFIQAQAGSLGKALSEAVMNSIDAYGSRVDITVTQFGFSIEDDGKGFQSRDEVQAWFETLGFPHEEGNHRLYGKFGMGRAQMWAYASTVWHSNSFVMRVDVKKTGLDYALEEMAIGRKGTLIEATFYEPMNEGELVRLNTELEDLCRYVPADVYLNDKLISMRPEDEDWPIETKQAWMRLQSPKLRSRDAVNTLSVYNAGVLVAHFPKYRFGVAGVVVTKPDFALSLNIARNEILEKDCKVWPQIVKALREFVARETDAPKKEARVRESDVKLMATGTNAVKSQTLEEAINAHPDLLLSIAGRQAPMQVLMRANTVLFADPKDPVARRISKLKLATVLNKSCLKHFGMTSARELYQALLEELKAKAAKTPRMELPHRPGHFYETHFARYVRWLEAARWVDQTSDILDASDDGRQVYTDEELSPADLGLLRLLRKSFGGSLWRNALSVAARQEPPLEQAIQYGVQSSVGFRLGVSDSGSCWTIPTRVVVVDLKRLRKAANAGVAGLTAFGLAVLREYLQSVPQGEELFLRCATSAEFMASTLSLSRDYMRSYEDLGLPKPEHIVDVLAGLEP